MSAVSDALEGLGSAASAFATSMDNFASMAKIGGIEQGSISIGSIGSPPTIGGNWGIKTEQIDGNFRGRTIPTASVGTVAFTDPGTAPTFDRSAPVVTLPTIPTLTIPDVPTAVPTFNAPTLPDAPTNLNLPPVPSITEVAMPAAPSVSIPAFDATFADYDLQNFVPEFDWVEQPYQDALLDELKAKLMRDLVNGGYGIEPQDEEGLWMRAVDREVRNSERAIQEANRAAAARGFSLPPGALFAQMEAVRQDAMEKNSGVQRDIALKRADLYVQNRQFTIQETRQIETVLLNYWAGVQERALQAAKGMVELGVLLFNSRLARLNYFLEQYKVKAAVYETQLKASLANLEAYKAQMEGVKVAVDVQRARVDLYSAQLQGIKTTADIYRTEMEAASIQANIENMKLTAFRTGVEGFKALVDAKVAVYTAYRAQIDGEQAKVQLFTAQVQAYAAQVEGYKARVQAEVARVQGASVQAEVAIKNVDAQAHALSAEAQVYSATMSAKAEQAKVNVEAAKAAQTAVIEATKANVAGYEAHAHATVAAASAIASVSTQNASTANATAASAASTAASVASAYASAMSAALSGIGALEANITTAAGG